MNALENNKLIADFMQLDSKWMEFHQIKYDTDWNWLMEVVEKIESLDFSIEMNKQEETDYQCLITKGNDIIFQTFSNIKIEAVYNACVEFIKWHNQTN